MLELVHMHSPVFLPHEHVFSRHRASDRGVASSFLRSVLAQAAAAGVSDIVDLTAYTNPLTYVPMIGDAPLRVHACVGFYLDNKVRRDVRDKSTTDLTRLLLERHRRVSRQMSVAGIKVAARHAKLSEFESRAFKAAAAAHEATGLPIITHSADGALAHQRTLMELGVPPERILLSHPELGLKGRSKRPFTEVLDEACSIVSQGSSICVTDVYSPRSNADAGALDLVAEVIQRGWGTRVMLSGDVSWQVRKGLGGFRGSSSNQELGFRVALCASDKLAKRGVSAAALRQIYSINPYEFYGVVSPDA